MSVALPKDMQWINGLENHKLSDRDFKAIVQYGMPVQALKDYVKDSQGKMPQRSSDTKRFIHDMLKKAFKGDKPVAFRKILQSVSMEEAPDLWQVPLTLLLNQAVKQDKLQFAAELLEAEANPFTCTEKPKSKGMKALFALFTKPSYRLRWDHDITDCAEEFSTFVNEMKFFFPGKRFMTLLYLYKTAPELRGFFPVRACDVNPLRFVQYKADGSEEVLVPLKIAFEEMSDRPLEIFRFELPNDLQEVLLKHEFGPYNMRSRHANYVGSALLAQALSPKAKSRLINDFARKKAGWFASSKERERERMAAEQFFEKDDRKLMASHLDQETLEADRKGRACEALLRFHLAGRAFAATYERELARSILAFAGLAPGQMAPAAEDEKKDD